MESESRTVKTIFDRPRGLRLIGLTQMLFGLFGILATFGLLYAWYIGVPDLIGVGPLYAAVLFFGVALPCLVIGNYVDDLRKNAVVAQIFYSFFAVVLCAYFLYWRGPNYRWSVPFFNMTIDVFVGNLAIAILIIEFVFGFYLIIRWKHVVPPPGVRVVRDRRKARLIERGVLVSPLEPALVGPDNVALTPEEEERVLQIRKIKTKEGMAILCSNCGGATPLTKMGDDNTIRCDYCGVRLAAGSVFVPCKNHPEFLAATSCAVCGDYFCRRCLTAQEPPIDERWTGATIFLCEKCFEGRYRPAVTTTSLVLPIEDLFSQAGGRFAKLGSLYKRFLGAYARSMKYVLEWGIRVGMSMARGFGKGGRGGDNAIAALLVIAVIIVAIPAIVAILMLLAGIIIIPLLFYAGLVNVIIQAVRIIRKTDFISLAEARERGIKMRKPIKTKPIPTREHMQFWQVPQESHASGKEDSIRTDSLNRGGSDQWRRYG